MHSREASGGTGNRFRPPTNTLHTNSSVRFGSTGFTFAPPSQFPPSGRAPHPRGQHQPRTAMQYPNTAHGFPNGRTLPTFRPPANISQPMMHMSMMPNVSMSGVEVMPPAPPGMQYVLQQSANQGNQFIAETQPYDFDSRKVPSGNAMVQSQFDFQDEHQYIVSDPEPLELEYQPPAKKARPSGSGSSKAVTQPSPSWAEKVHLTCYLGDIKDWVHYKNKGYFEFIFVVYATLESEVMKRPMNRYDFLLKDGDDSEWVHYYAMDQPMKPIQRGQICRFQILSRPCWGLQVVGMDISLLPEMIKERDEKVAFGKKMMKTKLEQIKYR